MICEKYNHYELGQLGEKAFKAHVAECTACQALIRQDDDLLDAAASLNREVHAPLLWAQIENRLRDEQNRWRRFGQKVSAAFKHPAMRIAASVVIAVGVGISIMLFRTQEPDAKLLTKNALKRVEQIERQHAQSIAELERIAEPRMAEMDLDLMLLYRDRLETIDEQIARCKEALNGNPANAHIRRYLLAALQDKKETLAEIIDFKS